MRDLYYRLKRYIVVRRRRRNGWRRTATATASTARWSRGATRIAGVVVVVSAAVFATTAAFAAGANELHIGSLNIQRISLIVVAVSPFFDL